MAPSKTAKAPTRIAYFDQESGCQLTAEFMEIDPALAAEMLKNNPDNRTISPVTVDAYVRAMTNGEWRPIGDPIRLNKDDEVLDGAHRLSAIVKSGTTHTIMVVRGIPTEHRKVMDQGRPRTTRDNLFMEKISSHSAKATIASLLIKWDMGAITSNKVRLQNQQVVDFVLANDGSLTRAVAQARACKAAIGLSVGAAGSVFYRANEIDVWQTNEFFSRLVTGEGLTEGSPIKALRNTIVRTKLADRSRRRVTTLEELFYVVRAWNAFRGSEYISKMQLPQGSSLGPGNFVLK